MAASLLFLDGQRHYATAQMASKYTSVHDPGATTWTIESSGGPADAPHILRATDVNLASADGYLIPRTSRCQAGAWTPTNSGLIGFFAKVDDLGKVSSTLLLASLDDTGLSMVRVFLSNAGVITVYRDNAPFDSTTLVSSASGAFQSNTWHHVQIKYELANSGGRVVVRVDRVNVADTGSTDTLGRGSTVTTIYLLQGRAASATLNVRMASLFIYGMTSFADQVNGHDYLDGRAVGYRPADANGNTNDFTPSAGSNYQNVDESSPDSDTTYNESSTVGHVDLFSLADLPSGVTPDAQQLVMFARRETTDGTTAIKPVIRHGGANHEGAEQGISSDAYTYLLAPLDTNPGTSAAWTESNANAAEYGVKKTA